MTLPCQSAFLLVGVRKNRPVMSLMLSCFFVISRVSSVTRNGTGLVERHKLPSTRIEQFNDRSEIPRQETSASKHR